MNKEISAHQTPRSKESMKDWFSPIPSLVWFLGILEHMRLSATGILSSPKDHLHHGKKVPIYLMVPGFTGNNATMSVLGGHIAQRANVIYAPEFWNFNTWSIADSASKLADKLWEVLDTDWLSRDVRVVAYSNGWLITLEALRKNRSLRVDEVITMGTPFFGTPLAYPLSLFVPACSDVNRQWGYFAGCDFSRQIRGSIIAHVSHRDSIVPSSSQFPWYDIAPGKVNRVDHASHTHTCFVVWESAKRTAQRILWRK